MSGGSVAPLVESHAVSEVLLYILFLVVGLAFLGATVFLVLWRRRARLPGAIEALPPVSADAYSFVGLDDALPAFDRSRLTLEAQSPPWRQSLAAVGRQMAAAGVHSIVYAHGTFVGSDPLGVTGLLEDLHPALGRHLAAGTRALIKKGSNRLVRDMGNFSPEYVALCRAGLSPAISCRELPWSSANNHFARLEGALALLFTLAKAVDDGFDARKQRFLVIGHSHAGQVFALFTQLLGDGEIRKGLLRLIEEDELLAPKELKLARAALRNVAIDFVTLGTSPNYPWLLGPGHRLLHIINHRGDAPEGGNLSGLLMTKTGDYIQQFGLAGSDTLALTKRQRQVNLRLNDVLGRGVSMKALVMNLRNRRRLSAQGYTYLVDFRDASAAAPNFLKTSFGHGVYTRYDVLLYLHRLIARHFYS